MRVDFCTIEVGQRMSASFTEIGILGMFEAANYEKIDLVSPFFEEKVDVCCKNTRKAPVTDVFSLNVDLVN